MNIQPTAKIQSLARGYLARNVIKQKNNAATKIQSVYRGHKFRKGLAQNQDYILRKALYNWVNEVLLERTDRQSVKDQIQIINGQLVVNGDLDTYAFNISSLPQGLHVTGNLDLSSQRFRLRSLPQGLTVGKKLILRECIHLTSLPQDLTVGRTLDLSYCRNLRALPQSLSVGSMINIDECTSLTELNDGIFNAYSLFFGFDDAADRLQQTNTYKTFQILQHFDKHDSIDGIGNQALIDLYHQDQDRIDALKYNRHCFRIAHTLYNKAALTDQQKTFKNTADEDTKNKIRNHLIHMIIKFNPPLFKQLPGINKYTTIPHKLPYVATTHFLPTRDVQCVRITCRPFSKSLILDQKAAYKDPTLAKPGLETFEEILENYHWLNS